MKKLKSGRHYFIINVDEFYAPLIYKIMKYGQARQDKWPEGNISFKKWKEKTFKKKECIKIEPIKIVDGVIAHEWRTIPGYINYLISSQCDIQNKHNQSLNKQINHR